MKVKQQTLKGFECEIEDPSVFKEYYTKNAPLMQGHLLILKGEVDTEIKAFLDDTDTAYVDANKKKLLTRKKRSVDVPQRPVLKESFVSDAPIQEKTQTLYHRPIRSGEVVEGEENLVFLGRINSGALIESASSIQLFGTIDGLVRSEGPYLLLKEIGKGNVIFHGEELDKSQFDGSLKLVEYTNGAIVIKEVE